MILNAHYLEETARGVKYQITFSLDGNDYFWKQWFPKRAVDVLEKGKINIPEDLFLRLKQDIELNHPFNNVRYDLKFYPEKILWSNEVCKIKVKFERPKTSPDKFELGVSLNGWSYSFLAAMSKEDLREVGKQIFRFLAENK